VPDDAVILVHDASVVSELTRKRYADIVGLKTPANIDAHARWTWPTCGATRGNAIADIVAIGWRDLPDRAQRVGLPVQNQQKPAGTPASQ
jgi:hypothetical protein